MRILLIDDASEYHEEFEHLLRQSNIRYSALDYALDAVEGARLMACDAHDIYFVDNRLPAGNGLNLIEQARAAGLCRPVVMLTAFEIPEVELAAAEAGANDFLVKGEFTPQMLARAVRYARSNATAIEAARRAERRFAMAQDAANIGTWDWDIRSNTVIWSPQLYAIFGVDPSVPPSDLYACWLNALHPDDRDAAQAGVTSALAGRGTIDSLFRISRPDPADPLAKHAIRWISCKGEVIRDASGRPTRAVGLNVDVTDHQNALRELSVSRNRALADLEASEHRFQTYFDSSPACMIHFTKIPDGRFVYEDANAAALASVGLTRDMVRGRTPEEVLGPGKGGMLTGWLRSVHETGGPYQCEPTWKTESGTVTYDAMYLPLRDRDGQVAGVLGHAQDITERRRLEASLRQVQKMEALGQLAGGVAHDFNNLLTGMLGCFELVERHVTSDTGRRFIVEGKRAVERGAALTQRLLAFSRQQPMTTEAVDLNIALESMSDMLLRTLGGAIRVGKRLAPDLWRATVDRNQVELAVMNLAINARDAMPVGGTLTIETRNVTIAAQQEGGPEPGDYVAIAVIDTGVGMAPEVLERVLEPFFTTKGPDKGTGLGLSMVYGAVRQLGGGITITSEPGKGTCVTLYLPREGAGVAEAETSRRAPLVARAPILLVDDDPNTQMVVSAYASENGHSILVANTGAEALGQLAAGHPVDMLIADATLPGLSGEELIAHVRARRPGLPALLISGDTAAVARATSGGIPILAKPFKQDALTSAIAGVLGSAADPAKVVPLSSGRLASDGGR
ncbi:MAG: response regulator [Acetobacteraceae bacterium]